MRRIWVFNCDYDDYQEIWSTHSANGGGADDEFTRPICSNATNCGCSAYVDAMKDIVAETQAKVDEIRNQLTTNDDIRNNQGSSL